MKPIIEGKLPEILVSTDGSRIETLDDWESIRRPEICEFFTNEVYGHFPPRPEDLQFAVIAEDITALDSTAIQKTIQVSFSGPYGSYSFPFYMFVPKSENPVGATLLICNRSKTDNLDLLREVKSEFWPVEGIVARGYAACAYWVEDVDTDSNDGFANGVHHCFNATLGPHDWGTLSAWAWAAMRIMDYFEIEPLIDSGRVAVVGHSRGGKTSLFCGALDTRFSAVFSSDSGCVGSALSRYKDGETIQQINQTFPYWFSQAFKRFNEHEFALPFDQHELLAAIAPRLLYVTSATMDEWADPVAEYTSTYLAGQAYGLYGMKGLPDAKPPRPCLQVCGDAIGYHLRPGIHDLTIYDWNLFLDFFSSHC